MAGTRGGFSGGAMIPHFVVTPLRLGPLELHPFGLLVVIAILVGTWVTVRRGLEAGLEERVVRAAVGWVLVGGFLGAHLFAVLAYEPQLVLARPWVLLQLWSGLSSTGGFVGALLGLLLFVRLRHQPLGRLADVVALGLLPGWIFGRLGCYLAHDHPGRRSDFILAVAYPGGPRHDLGFYEMLVAAALFGLFECVRRRIDAPGRVALWVAVAYAPVRFALDHLRALDRRYAGFTPAQWACAALFVGCVAALLAMRRRRVHGIGGGRS
jgi:phosphatidylglycerol:prolipoprotein diacylglycerol transferase